VTGGGVGRRWHGGWRPARHRGRRRSRGQLWASVSMTRCVDGGGPEGSGGAESKMVWSEEAEATVGRAGKRLGLRYEMVHSLVRLVCSSVNRWIYHHVYLLVNQWMYKVIFIGFLYLCWFRNRGIYLSYIPRYWGMYIVFYSDHDSKYIENFIII
jgi:hypothetical protein